MNAVLGLSTTYQMRPATTGVPAVGINCPSGAGAWGATTVIFAAGAITTEFWVCGAYLSTLGAAQIFEGRIINLTLGTNLTEWRVDPTAITANLGLLPAGPYPVYCAGSTAINGQSGGAAAKTCSYSLLIGVGL